MSDINELPSAQNAINGANGGTGTGGLFGSMSSGVQTAGSLANIAGGIRSGTATGYTSAGLGAAGLANKAGAFGANSSVGGAIGGANNLLGIYGGIKQGGALGYTGAAANAAQLGGNLLGSSALSSAGGYVAAPLAIYGAIKGYQSGDTGGDALRGAEAGAAIGSVVPVVGTAVGAIVGGAVGAISSAFGNGKVDPENKNFVDYTQQYNKANPAQKDQLAASVQNPYLPLAGYFDLRSNQLKGSNPIYTTYGRMGEAKFTNDLVGKVQQGKASGITDPTQIWSQVIQPWIGSMGNWQDSNKDAMTSLIKNMTGQIIDGTYKKNFKATGGDAPFQG